MAKKQASRGPRANEAKKKEKRVAAKKATSKAAPANESNDELAADVTLDVVHVERFGRLFILALTWGDARFSLAIEQPIEPQKVFGRAHLAVSTAAAGASLLASFTAWLDTPPPEHDANASLRRPAPLELGYALLQTWTDELDRTWHRSKLTVVFHEVYLVWSESGGEASLSEKSRRDRAGLVEEFAAWLGVGERPDDAGETDPLRSDPTPLVTSLSLIRSDDVELAFWRGDRFFFFAHEGPGTAIFALTSDGRAEEIATIAATVDELCEVEPCIVALTERDEGGEVWIVPPGERTGRKLRRRRRARRQSSSIPRWPMDRAGDGRIHARHRNPHQDPHRRCERRLRRRA